ncbi:MAG: YebC/PmpR family DNA-binding transcriptional regulator [Acidiferrobacteraceae bacterium]|nr:YebC/PmpR family DNA-binding transcriptional regulator [Acidiferrobacteraceae bacterium]
MAGHSKWANIRFRKAAQDAKRGKLFTKLIREITVASRSGGADPASNPRLRTAIDKALSGNMTRDTVDRAIKRGTGELDGAEFEEIRYEGYASGGTAVLVECTTDNRNRTVSEVRHIFTKYGGNLGTDGSVAYLFEKAGVFVFSPEADEDLVMDTAVSAGAEDVEISEDSSIEVTCLPTKFENIMTAFSEASLTPEFAEIVQRPTSDCSLSASQAENVLGLISALEELDDVQDVFTNASFPDDIQSAA